MSELKSQILIEAAGHGESTFIPMIADDDTKYMEGLTPDAEVPLLPLRNMVLFPGVVLPINIGRKKSLTQVRDVFSSGGVIGVVAQKDGLVEEPTVDDLYSVGTIAQILRILEMPDGSTTVILQGRCCFRIVKVVSSDPYFKANVVAWQDSPVIPKTREFKAHIAAIKDATHKIVRLSGGMHQDMMFAIKNIDSPLFIINFISCNINIPLQEKQSLLEIVDIQARAYKLVESLAKEVNLLEIKNSIQTRAMENIDKQQREYYLQQQMKTIQKELGGTTQEQDIKALEEKAKTKKWNAETKEFVEKEMAKLQALSSNAPDYSIQLNYVQTLVDLPWNEYTEDDLDLKRAQKVLDSNHYGLDDVKERIIEHLAVLKLKGDMKSPIICLYGPPGVGKTSLGKSVAEALGRKYARVSLGGLHDEAEIRGHRRTYIGAMPGRIIQSILKAGSSNPVFILDEIDKVGADYKGDPASALLEVLDPEQNCAFHDNYLDVNFDLSKVLFIATANTLSTISPALLDRMELINISGYIMQEKIEIAQRHLIPDEWKNHGITKKQASIQKRALQYIVERYTKESGVRTLDKRIATIARKVAKKVALEEEYKPSIDVNAVKEFLGTEVYSVDVQGNNSRVGKVTGLAWTSVGGVTLEIETSISKGKAAGLKLTGNLGDVMKESASLGLSYIKAHAKELGVKDKFFETASIHIHVPEGAIPKDGPSAGITIATSLLSAITGRKVRKHIAMTGEITLLGDVLPVGGIKEKILAAKRAGVTTLILCAENRRNIEEVKPIYIEDLDFHYVTNVKEVFKLALE
ncbi:MAG: endopeptidase La [Bacteroidales bacterium]|nr:endopeptidase La [Bacteroidales bacterium]MDY6426430.1 endopeptidase La [Bacteroidales bacterium]